MEAKINIHTSPSIAYFGAYTEAFRLRVHQLVVTGFKDSRSEVQDGEEETAITGLIATKIKNRLRGFNCPRWYKYFSVHDDPPVDSGRRRGKYRPRTDLIIEGTFKGRPEYTFEAKRLFKGRSGASEYVGGSGMMCFISGQYAARYDEAGMLGYVQTGRLDEWKERIASKIARSPELENLQLPSTTTIVPEFPDGLLSLHRRKSPHRQISLYHIFLDYSDETGKTCPSRGTEQGCNLVD